MHRGARLIVLMSALAASSAVASVATSAHASTGPGPMARTAAARPASCPPVPANQGGPDGEPISQRGTFPWPQPPAGTDPTRYQAYTHTPVQDPPLRPANWNNGGADWKLTSARSTDQTVNQNPQELCGVQGSSVDQAWQVSTGRPTTVIAVLDSGIEWCASGVVDKIYLNRQALPLPQNAQGLTKPQLAARGARFRDADPYDLNDDGVLNVEDYAQDPRVARPYFCSNGISPKDLIAAFTTLGRQAPAGFTEAIAGWNFVDNSNDPYDDVHYDHGTGEAHDSTGAANSTADIGTCPNCMVLPVRVGDSFIAFGNDFAQGVLFAVDSGATVIQEALGTMDVTTSARDAVEYASAHGVPIVASAADEEAAHHNLPSVLPHTIVVNSTTHYEEQQGQALQYPKSYLYLNGCTNYGANIAVTVESASCSSEATGKTGGIVGLLESAATDGVLNGTLHAYPGLRSATGATVPLSSNEVQQLVTMTADDVDFQTAAPPYGPPDNYAVVSPVPTVRYPTGPGFDVYTGYGRLNAASILRRVGAGEIPPEARIDSPTWFDTIATSATLNVTGMVAAVRASSYSYAVQVGQGPSPADTAWVTVAAGSGTSPKRGTLATVSGAQLAALFPATTDLGSGPTDATGQPNPDKFAFTVRVVVVDDRGRTGMDRRSDYLHSDLTLLPGFPKHFGGSIDATPTLAPIGPGGSSALLVATSDGDIHAYMPGGSELPGWPVHTAALDYHSGESGFSKGGVHVPHGAIIGGFAVGDLAGAHGSALDVVAGDVTGRVYAWDSHGRMLPGFPVRTLPQYSGPAVRDPHNRVLRGVFAAPVLADLDHNGGLDVVASAMDRHLYAWHPDGTPVSGFPLLVVDRSKVQSIDPVTNRVTYPPGSNVTQGTKVMDSPAVGALDGDGKPWLVVGTNEEYLGTVNASIASPVAAALAQVPILNSANSRVYAFDAHGTLHGNWPVAIGDYEAGLLPDVGDGTPNSPALGSVRSDGTLQVGVITTIGPGYVLNADGSSYLGTGPDGKPRVLGMDTPGPLSNSASHPSLPALGAPIFAPLGPAAPGVSMIAPAASLQKALDAALPADQQPHDNQLDAWNLATGEYQAAFPQVMGDLQFFVQPLVATVGGNSAGPYVVEGSALADIRAIDATGQEAPGFPKFTGGWLVNSPSFGAWGSLGKQVLVSGTREGMLFAWSTPTDACASSGPWPRGHHDLWNTNNLQTADAPKPQCSPR
ncbi:MAG TPA: S8 family serine peptidase [Candidatus Dormibacteraeota bacterium]|jgi:hypothetical protein|nr:S8 family serine peptidase [Candidatus Dormibacteraeota bacterium]